MDSHNELGARQILQSLTGFAVFVALFYSWLFTPSFVNRFVIYLHRDDYKPAVFVVKEATYYSGGDFGPEWWLTGDIGGLEERFVPNTSKGSSPRSADDLLERFPKGTKIDVLYNPDSTEMLSQYESLRVLEAQPNFWQREVQLSVRLGMRVLLPVPVAFTIYVLVRVANQRHRRLKTAQTPHGGGVALGSPE